MALRILFLCTAHNGLSQRAWAELGDRGHAVCVAVVADAAAMRAAVQRERPDLVIAPMLRTAIPEDIWSRHVCLIVHPGVVGDRGPSSLDWAILGREREWGVTLLQAAAEMDAGDIWASAAFETRTITKSGLYRHEVTDAAVRALLQAVERFEAGGFRPQPLDEVPQVRGRLRPAMPAAERRVDWEMDTEAILRRVQSGDSFPGAGGELLGLPCRLFGAHPEARLRGRPGEALAQRDGAVCIATGDAALWLSHLRVRGGIKLPAAWVLGEARLRDVPDWPLPCEMPDDGSTWREIRYREVGPVGWLHFDFYNGAMSTGQCERLRAALIHAKRQATRVVVLAGGADLWSNGIHLNTIEAAADPALESWRNILAMNALVREIVSTDSHLVVAALHGNAGAGGAILALAADQVWARQGVVLNPHYKGMGGLYGSEYWTYLLPRRVGDALAEDLTESLRPLTAAGAERLGLIDAAFGDGVAAFRDEATQRAQRLAAPADLRKALTAKRRRRDADERRKPLESYAAEELAHMHRNFFGPDDAYHEARRRFVYKATLPPPVRACTLGRRDEEAAAA
ncbi:hydrogenase maturation protein [Luteimonas sp. R10]|uniref:hydrogenase maturation protein n=1 Tax=Luteimonas sp. R10 TaxID=3108176 RepID=UPI0030907636|nr:enoyl-CoA hydratase-related protein [Luteimonas sp. R10]